MNTWIEQFKAALEVANLELTKREIYNATPLFVVATVNPKRANTMAHARFENYFNPAIVCIGDAIAAGLRQDDIRHDAEHGFILLGDQANDAFAALEGTQTKALPAPEPTLLLTFQPELEVA